MFVTRFLFKLTEPEVIMTKTFAKVLEKMQSSTYDILSYDDKTNAGSMSSCAKVTEKNQL